MSPALATPVSSIPPGPTPLATSAPVPSTHAPPTVTAESTGTPTAAPFPAMTTHWSRPLSCTWTYVADTEWPPSNSVPVAFLDLEPVPGASTLSCYPDGMFDGGRTGVFSPATCPNGWTTVSISVNTEGVTDDATTTALCCSSDYTLDGEHCKRQVPTALAVPITYNHTASTYELMTNSTTTLYGATIAVHTIRALFRSKDQAALGITDGSDIDDDPEPWHLSMAAKIGIGVGVTILGLLILTALVFLFLRMRHRERDRAKSRSLHEMESMHTSGARFYGIRRSPRAPNPRTHSTQDSSDRADHENGADSRSSGAEYVESGGAENHDEIRVLMAQKAAIQQRIDELERVKKGNRVGS